MFKRNRTISMLLAIAIIIVSILPASLVKASGDGTPQNPYIISGASDFELMRSNLGSSFVLANNIDLSGIAWTMIGSDNNSPFTGNIDGQGHSITGLSINANANVDSTGLFGAIGTSGKIKNLTIANATVSGNYYVGVLVGYNQGVIENVYITNANVHGNGGYTGGLAGLNDRASIRYCTVSGDVSGYYQVGGLVGFSSSSLIANSSTEVRVIGTSTYIGGLVGYNLSTSINSSYGSGDVSGGTNKSGGLVGYNENSPIDNSYALGNVSGGLNIGGLIGHNKSSSITNSYASGFSTLPDSLSSGILVGYNELGTITNSEWRSPSAYIISYNSNGGSNVVSQSVGVNGIATTTPDAPTKQGYTFAGWYSNSGLTTLYDFATLVTANTRLYAKWTINSYIVSFNSNEGSLVDSQTVDFRGTATLPTIPTRAGYRFTGWYSDSDLITAYNFSSAITANIMLYAKWTINYIVNYNSNGGSDVVSQLVDINGLATTPDTPTKTGYTFIGWYSDNDFTTIYDFAAAVTANMTLYANWTNTVYTVSFYSNEGTLVDSQPVEFKGTATLPTTPTKEGYSFTGWYSDNDLTTIYDFNAVVTADMTLYAKWTSTGYTVSFNSNEGSFVDSQSVDINGLAMTPDAPTKTGYTFIGWYFDNDLTTIYDFNAAVTANTTLYAKWTINSYTVTFNSNGGSAVANQHVNFNLTASIPKAPTKTGYTFDGWYSNSELTTPYNFTAAITVDTTLYVKWDTFAVAAVIKAEVEQTLVSVDEASMLVNNLSSDLEKNVLLVRLAAVQAIISNRIIHVDAIIKLLNEGTFQQKDINQDNTFDYKDIQIMLQRISPLY